MFDNMSHKFPLRTLVGILIAVAVASSGKAQTSDTAPPVLVGVVSISPNSVDVSAGTKVVNVTTHVTDDLSGVSFVCLQFTSPSGQQHTLSTCSGRGSGTALDGIYTASVQIPRYVEAGVWNLDGFNARDNTGNNLFYSTSNLQALGFPTALLVTSSPVDTQPPQVTNLSIVAPPGDLSSGPANLIMTIGLSDDLSGVDLTRFIGYEMVLASPSGRQHQYIAKEDFHILPGGTNLNGTYQITHSFPQYSEAGLWSISNLSVVDAVGNQANLSGVSLQAKGFNVNFTVISSQQDIQPPQITGLTFAPSTIDTSLGPQTVVVTMTLTDNLAGVDFSPDNPSVSTSHGIFFSSPSGQQTQNCCFFPPTFTLSAGTRTNGTWTATITFPQFSEAGSWTAQIVLLKDSVQNVLSLSSSDLQLRGLPFQLTIFKPSTAPDGSVGPGGGTVQDATFGNRASISFPPGAVTTNTTVAIDVLTNPPPLPTPSGFSAGSFFENIILTPTPSFPLPPPGLTVVLPMLSFTTPGTQLTLFRFDPAQGKLVPAVSVTGSNVVGAVNPSGTSATFTGVAHLSTLVAFAQNNHILGDVDGDNKVDCTDLGIVRGSFGKRVGDPGFDPRADVNNDGLVNILDLAIVSRQLPPGIQCQ